MSTNIKKPLRKSHGVKSKLGRFERTQSGLYNKKQELKLNKSMSEFKE